MGATRVRPEAHEVRDIIDLMVSLSPYAAEALAGTEHLRHHYAHIKAREVARALVLSNTLTLEDAKKLTAYLVKYPQARRREEVDEPFGRDWTLRMPLSMEAQVEAEAKRLGMADSVWIREAIAEKLARDTA